MKNNSAEKPWGPSTLSVFNILTALIISWRVMYFSNVWRSSVKSVGFWNDFQYVKTSLSLELVLEKYNLVEKLQILLKYLPFYEFIFID